MLWYCRFKWNPGTTNQKVREREIQQHAAGTNHPEKIRGWYNLAGGGAGFMMIEADDPRELTPILEPYMDLVSWDVHACYELPYQEVVEHFNEMIHSAHQREEMGARSEMEEPETMENAAVRGRRGGGRARSR